jgi:signal transduction histidine kinase
LLEGSKALFFRAAGHDMRQPLQTLAILVEILRRRADDPDLRSLVDRQDTALWTTRTLVDGFLDACRLDSGVLSPSPRPVALNTLLKGLDEALSEQAARRQIRLRFGASSVSAIFDSVLLHRCLVMLTTHFMVIANGVGRIFIGCRRRGGGVRIEVWSDGAVAEVPRLAEALQDSRLADEAWHGLTLAVARHCAHALDAPIEVRRVGDCVVCALTLPRAIAA